MSKVPIVDMSDYDTQGCLDEMFKNQANATPNAVAVINTDGSVVSLMIHFNLKTCLFFNVYCR